MEQAKDIVMTQIASYMVSVGVSSSGRSVFPNWMNEPEMPQSMIDELE